MGGIKIERDPKQIGAVQPKPENKIPGAGAGPSVGDKKEPDPELTADDAKILAEIAAYLNRA